MGCGSWRGGSRWGWVVSKRVGRRWEREIIAILRDHYGLDVDDVASNAGIGSEHGCDLVLYHDGRPIRCEVKYRRRATGFKHLYDTHLSTVGLGTVDYVRWNDGYASGGIVALLASMRGGEDDAWEHEGGCLTVTLDGWMNPDNAPARDVLFLRVDSRKVGTSEWVVVWRV